LIEQGLTSPPTQYRLYGRRAWYADLYSPVMTTCASAPYRLQPHSS